MHRNKNEATPPGEKPDPAKVLARGIVRGGVVVLNEGVSLPEGMKVLIHVEAPSPDAPLAALADLADSFPDDPDWPVDGAAEVDHYLYGTPKRNG